MVRWIALTAAFAFVVFVALKWGGYLDGPDRTKALRALMDEHSKLTEEALSTFRQAKSQADQKAAIDKFPSPAAYVQKALKIAEVDPKDETGFQALGFAYSISGGNDERVVELLTENHAKDPKIKAACWLSLNNLGQQNGAYPPVVPKLMKEVLERNPDTEARAWACIYLGSIAAASADSGDKDAMANAEKYLDRVTREFPEVILPNKKTAGESASFALKMIRAFAVGCTAPDAESEDLKGSKVQLANYRGKVVVLDFWFTACPPCRQMIPQERQMVKKFADMPFQFISISADEKKEMLEKFLEKEAMPWVHWWEGPRGKMISDWNVFQFPTIYVLDSHGVIRYKNLRGEDLEAAVAKLLEETKKEGVATKDGR